MRSASRTVGDRLTSAESSLESLEFRCFTATPPAAAAAAEAAEAGAAAVKQCHADQYSSIV